ncbi:MAG: hypothetical protein KKD18_06275 [Nanoarchaeota archaeon]|nr:hypothetical protein [Nanoarchaeota archaeon]
MKNDLIKSLEKLKGMVELGVINPSAEIILNRLLGKLKSKQIIISDKDEIILRLKKEDIRKADKNSSFKHNYMLIGKKYIQDQLKAAMEAK